MKAYCHYAGTGTRVRVWVSGDTEFTETSYFQVSRDMDVDFEKLPVDASLAMEDNVMDLMEPYGYEALENFRPEYMSGFLGEIYNQDAETLEKRARDKAGRDASVMLHNTLNGYTTLIPQQENISLNSIQSSYALLPVWWYRYSFEGKIMTALSTDRRARLWEKHLCRSGEFLPTAVLFSPACH